MKYGKKLMLFVGPCVDLSHDTVNLIVLKRSGVVNI